MRVTLVVMERSICDAAKVAEAPRGNVVPIRQTDC